MPLLGEGFTWDARDWQNMEASASEPNYSLVLCCKTRRGGETRCTLRGADPSQPPAECVTRAPATYATPGSGGVAGSTGGLRRQENPHASGLQTWKRVSPMTAMRSRPARIKRLGSSFRAEVELARRSKTLNPSNPKPLKPKASKAPE